MSEKISEKIRVKLKKIKKLEDSLDEVEREEQSKLQQRINELKQEVIDINETE